MGELIERLRDPSCYSHPVGEVEVVETHVSWILLAGPYAYKVKKPVRLPFLDFTTLEQRQRFCREELRLNRRTAPQIYLDVVPIAGDPPRVGGEGVPREWALRMRRYPEDAVLERRAAAHRLEAWQLEQLGEALARFHGEAAVAGERQDFGNAAAVRAPAEANFTENAGLGGRFAEGPLATALERLAGWTRREGARLERTFTARKADGFVRECHGDLHLGNVLLAHGAPLLVDALEFDPALRWIDVMNDVAFLFMDLVRRGEPRLAYRFLDRYLERTGDFGGLAVLRYYSVYRAMVRAKVSAIRLTQLEAEHLDLREQERELDGYLKLAARLAQREPPLVVLMHGVAASGKTTASTRLVEALGAIRLRSDVERKRLHGLRALERAAAPPGEGLYATDATDRTYERLAELARDVVEAGYPVIVDATFHERARRDRFRALAASLGAAFEIVCCEAPDDVLRGRVEKRLLKGADASDAGVDVLERQIAAREPLADEESVHATRLDTTSVAEWHGALESFARRFRIPMGGRQ